MTEDYYPDDEDYALRCPGCHRSCPGIQPIRVDEYTPTSCDYWYRYDEDGNQIDVEVGEPISGATEYEPVYLCPHCNREFFTPFYDAHRPILVDDLLTDDEEPEQEAPL